MEHAKEPEGAPSLTLRSGQTPTRGSSSSARQASSLKPEDLSPADPQKKIEALQHQLGQIQSQQSRLMLQNDILLRGLILTQQLLEQKREESARLRASLAWHLLDLCRSWSRRWLPFGSLRREYLRRIVAAASRLIFDPKVRDTIAIQSWEDTLPPTPRGGLTAAGQPTGAIMDCESPRPGDSCRGVVLVRGWALTSASIEQIEIFLDGQKLGEATYSHHRSDLQCGCSSDPEGGRCGFNFAWDSAGVTEGLHVLTVSAQGKTGSPMVISIPVVVDPILAESEFDRWIAASEPSPERLKEMAREAGRFAHRPLLSIIVSVSCVPLKPLRAAIESVRNQLYTNWELCLADDGSHMPELAQLLQDYAAHDPRIKYAEPSEKRDISKASNAALALAAGEFVGFLDQDDELAPDALYWVVKLLQERLDADVIYSDEDRLDLNGKRSEPFFKPDWSPDLLLSFNYIRHFLVVRRQLLTELGGFRSACNGSQDYDLLLRLMAHTSKVLHLPRILYHCRAMRDSAVAAERKAHEVHAARRALEEYLLSNQVGARLEPGCEPGKWLVRYEVRGNPKVAVIMLTGGRMELLRPCLESFFTTTDYGNCEILLVDNSKGSDVEQYAAGLAQETRKLQLIDCRNKKFNYSALNNVAARRTGAPLLLLLNDDMTVVNEDWLTAMVEHAQRPKVGAVGAKLLYPSGRIQHAGAVMGIYGGTSHAFKHLPGNSRHYFCLAQVVRNCSHVTAACLMTKRSLYLEFGGLDEKHFKVAFQDVDYCLRLHKAGYFIVYTPAAVLVHHESATKNEKMPNLWEVRHLKKKWAEIIAHDPFYNPNLTRQSEDYRLRLE